MWSPSGHNTACSRQCRSDIVRLQHAAVTIAGDMEDRILKTGVNKKSSHWNSGAVHRGASKRAFRDSAVPGNAFPEK